MCGCGCGCARIRPLFMKFLGVAEKKIAATISSRDFGACKLESRAHVTCWPYVPLPRSHCARRGADRRHSALELQQRCANIGLAYCVPHSVFAFRADSSWLLPLRGPPVAPRRADHSRLLQPERSVSSLAVDVTRCSSRPYHALLRADFLTDLRFQSAPMHSTSAGHGAGAGAGSDAESAAASSAGSNLVSLCVGADRSPCADRVPGSASEDFKGGFAHHGMLSG